VEVDDGVIESQFSLVAVFLVDVDVAVKVCPIRNLAVDLAVSREFQVDTATTGPNLPRKGEGMAKSLRSGVRTNP
jgi:hypothetical protein